MLKQEELDSIKDMTYLCELEPTMINGVWLQHEDFGDHEDIDHQHAEPYACANMQFIPFKEVKEETLKKYNITEEEYRQIQDKLDCLSFGCCGWCV